MSSAEFIIWTCAMSVVFWLIGMAMPHRYRNTMITAFLFSMVFAALSIAALSIKTHDHVEKPLPVNKQVTKINIIV